MEYIRGFPREVVLKITPNIERQELRNCRIMKLDILNTHMQNQQCTFSAFLVWQIVVWEHFYNERVQRWLTQTFEVNITLPLSITQCMWNLRWDKEANSKLKCGTVWTWSTPWRLYATWQLNLKVVSRKKYTYLSLSLLKLPFCKSNIVFFLKAEFQGSELQNPAVLLLDKEWQIQRRMSWFIWCHPWSGGQWTRWRRKWMIIIIFFMWSQ